MNITKPDNENYISVVKFFLDNFNFTTIHEDYFFENTDGNHLIANTNQFLSQFFSAGFYYINDNPNTTFHDKDLIKFLEKYNKKVSILPLNECLSSDKPFICEMGLHPRTQHPSQIKDGFLDKIFQQYPTFLQRLRDSSAFLFLFFGWEADNFTNTSTSDGVSYHQMFMNTRIQYGLEKNSIIVLNSNLDGYDLERQSLESPTHSTLDGCTTIYESALEHSVFKDNSDYLDINYSIEDYLENIKRKDIKRVLRINRTQSLNRDIILYFLHKSGNIGNTLIEHSKLLNDSNIFNQTYIKEFEIALSELTKIDYNLELDLGGILSFDKNMLTKIKNELPYTASTLEKNGEIEIDGVFSNAPIPNHVYKESKCSWVSTSLFERSDQVFLNHSTFKPMLYYHPLLITGNYRTSLYLKNSGYKSYEWFYAESEIDVNEGFETRLLLSIYEAQKIYTMSEDEFLSNISDNFGDIAYNRDLLFECRSIRNIIMKLYDSIKNSIVRKNEVNII